jgi:DNA-binding transcriptional MerR regulator
MSDLTLTSPQVVDVIRKLDGEDLNPRTLAAWAAMGVAVPTFWPRKKGRTNVRHYTMADLARVRLIVRLRCSGVSMHRVRVILATVEDTLPELLKRKTRAELIVNGWSGAIVRRPGRADVEVPSGQTVLPLSDVIEGNEKAAREAVKVA